MSEIQDIDRLVASTGPAMTVQLIDQPDPAVRQAMLSLWGRMQAAMPWGPQNLQMVAANLWDRYRRFAYPSPAILPPQAVTPDQRQAWQEAARGWRSFNDTVFRKQMAIARDEGARLDANAAFWQTIYRYSGAEAIQKVWDDFWNALNEFKSKRDAAQRTLSESARALQSLGPKAPANLRARQAALESQVVTLTNQAKSTLSPIPGAAAQSGLGAIPWMVVGISGSIIASITLSIWALVRTMAAVQTQANDHAQEVLMFREKADREDYQAGRITEDQYVVRRGQNETIARTVASTQGAGAVGSGLASAGSGILMAAIGIGGVALLGFYLWRQYKTSAPRVAAAA